MWLLFNVNPIDIPVMESNWKHQYFILSHSQMELENHKTKENFTFMCNRWLSEDEDDKEIIRELPVGSDATDKGDDM